MKDGSGAVRKEEVDILIVSTGMYSTPNVPSFEGQAAFEGQIMHSSEFTANSMGAAKHVVVVGGSKAAIDVVVDSSKVCSFFEACLSDYGCVYVCV